MTTPADLRGVTKASQTPSGLEKNGARVFSGVAWTGVAWTGLAFACLQSVCTVLIGLGGARLLIGLLSLATASTVFARMDAFHADWLRIPMILFALLGSLVNLIVVAQVRRLRSRPAARWRLDMAGLPGKLRQERWQVLLSMAALVLVVVEEVLHHWRHGHW
jgi:hypothetical protein